MSNARGRGLPVPERREPGRPFRWAHEIFSVLGNMIGFSVPEPWWSRLGQEPRPVADRPGRYSESVLCCLADAPWAEIETRRAPTSPPRRMPIRTVTDEHGRVYGRPYEGRSSYWYRRILINPGVALHTDGGTAYARAVRETDAETSDLVTELYHLKYGANVPETDPDLQGLSAATIRFDPL